MRTSKLLFYALALSPSRVKKEVVLFVQREKSLLKVKQANADANLLRLYGYDVCIYSSEDRADLIKRMNEMRANREVQCLLHSSNVQEMSLNALLAALAGLKRKWMSSASKWKKVLLRASLVPTKSF